MPYGHGQAAELNGTGRAQRRNETRPPIAKSKRDRATSMQRRTEPNRTDQVNEKLNKRHPQTAGSDTYEQRGRVAGLCASCFFSPSRLRCLSLPPPPLRGLDVFFRLTLPRTHVRAKVNKDRLFSGRVRARVA